MTKVSVEKSEDTDICEAELLVEIRIPDVSFVCGTISLIINSISVLINKVSGSFELNKMM